MSRWERKKRDWQKRNNDRVWRRLRRKKKKHYSLPKRKVKEKGSFDGHYSLIPPNIFSLSENTDETVVFFADVFEVIHKCGKGNRIFFDLSNVERITPDAIMYFIAVINNSRMKREKHIHCFGTLPKKEEPKTLLEKVGFFDFVTSKQAVVKPKDSERIQILRGTESNVQVISAICDFVNEKIHSESLILTKHLYKMLLEMMANVKQHAYNDNSGAMFAQWYVYVENCEKEICFIFLDSGCGIPNTIRKNWMEKIKGFLNGDKDEPSYIEAALRGGFRTETKLSHRGKGLPDIYSAVNNLDNRLSQMTIISGHARCDIRSYDEIHKEYIENSFEGSLFMWSFLKGEVRE